jgi:hypothetical protein
VAASETELPHDFSAIAKIVDEIDWVDEAAARRAFNEAGSRGTELAEHMR